MTFHAATQFSNEPETAKAAAAVALALRASFAAAPLRVAIVYASVAHHQETLLRSLRAALGPDVPLVGCSVQGIVTSGSVCEGGSVVAVMGLGGESLEIAAAVERDIGNNSRASGIGLGKQLKSRLRGEPKVVLMVYDPLCRANVEELTEGLNEIVPCPIVGGGAGQPFGVIVKTYQYWQDEVIEHGAIALALAGPLSVELGLCHGASPTGYMMEVTKAEANDLVELDGRPALDVWSDITGCNVEEFNNQDTVANWAIGIERKVIGPNGEANSVYMVRASFGADIARGSVSLQAAIPEGANIMLHHRTVDAVSEGTVVMGQDLASRLQNKTPWAVLGFECGARTSPFLGIRGTLEENIALQGVVAPGAPWLGMMAWGEIAPVGGLTAFHNYTYPLLVLA